MNRKPNFPELELENIDVSTLYSNYTQSLGLNKNMVSIPFSDN